MKFSKSPSERAAEIYAAEPDLSVETIRTRMVAEGYEPARAQKSCGAIVRCQRVAREQLAAAE